MAERREWLVQMRIDRNPRLTQVQAAEQIGISATYLDKIENGHRNPPPLTAQKIASFYGFEWTRFYPPVSA